MIGVVSAVTNNGMLTLEATAATRRRRSETTMLLLCGSSVGTL